VAFEHLRHRLLVSQVGLLEGDAGGDSGAVPVDQVVEDDGAMARG
jgi:hypothetical protein